MCHDGLSEETFEVIRSRGADGYAGNDQEMERESQVVKVVVESIKIA